MERDYAFRHAQKLRYQIATILSEVSERNGLSVDQLKSKTRAFCIAWPRQEAMYRFKQIGLSVVDIGKIFDLDHTTISHGLRAYCRRNEIKLRGTVAWPLLPRYKKPISKTPPAVRPAVIKIKAKPKRRRLVSGTPLAEIATHSLNWQRKHGALTHIKTASR